MRMVLVVAIFLVDVNAARSETVRVTLPAFADAVTCHVRRDTKILATYHGRHYDLVCDDEATTLSCDGSGVEPLDLPLTDVCARKTVDLLPSITLRVDTGHRAVVSIEWLDIGSRGEVSSVAVRRVVAESGFDVLANERRSRFLRFHREGVSPVTIRVADVLPAKRWALPDGVPGGEFVALVEPATVSPIGFRFPSPEQVAPRTGDVLSVQGLSPMNRSFQIVYEGGIEKPPVSVRIDPAQSTLAFVPRGAVGAALVTGSFDACVDARVLVITQKQALPDPKIRGGIWQKVAEFDSNPECVWKFGGLDAGSYNATLEGNGWRAVADFEVEAQQVARVQVAKPTIVVSGRVTVNGQPAQGRVVRFMMFDKPIAAQAISDSEGRYSIALTIAGEYSVTLGVSIKKVTIAPGTNVFDWNVVGGMLTVRVENGTGETSIDMRSARGSWVMSQLKPFTTEHTFEALPFDAYRVWAREGDSTSSTVTVALNEANAERTVVLRLQNNHALLDLRNPSGVPVGGAQFPGTFPAPKEIRPGVYSLASVPPGAPLKIKPPAALVPVCRVVRDKQDVDVSFTQGRTITLELRGVELFQLGEGRGSLTGVEGSDCPLQLDDFDMSVTSKQFDRFVIRNFPLSDALVLTTRLGRHRLVVENGVVVLSGPR